MRIIFKAQEKEAERLIWQMWLTLYPKMDDKTFIPFSQFKAQTLRPQKSNKTTAELIAQAEIIKALDQKGGKQAGNI